MCRRTDLLRKPVVMRMAMRQRPGSGRQSSHVVREQHHHTGASVRRSGRG